MQHANNLNLDFILGNQLQVRNRVHCFPCLESVTEEMAHTISLEFILVITPGNSDWPWEYQPLSFYPEA